MKFVFYTNSVSAHQLPLARELVTRLGVDSYRYVYTGDSLQGGGQEVSAREPWIVQLQTQAEPQAETNFAPVEELLESCDVLMTGGLRPIDLIERRAQKGLRTFYYSERWFKPYEVEFKGLGRRWRFSLPGRLRMLVPGYRRMAGRFVRWLKTDPNARYLAVGPWAKKDMVGLGAPKEKIVDWGYFVEPSHIPRMVPRPQPTTAPIKVLWVGRMLDWKRVDTIIRAVIRVNKVADEKRLPRRFSLTLVGDGPEKARLQRMAARAVEISFVPSVPLDEVRALMCTHDVYVLSSNAQEGWGAALNEAMEEGMTCFGTYEAGASAALLSESHLFCVGDYKALALHLSNVATATSSFFTDSLPAAYTPKGAADKLMELIS